MRILIAEDESALADALARGLRERTFAVDIAADGESALTQALVNEYDAVVLDVMLPRRDGFHVCRELRRRGVQTPVLMLTARDAVDDRIAGLDAGADDYLVKPFAFGELVARLRALLRRSPLSHGDVLRVGDVEVDTASQRARRGDRRLTLTATEYALLEYLARNAGRVVSRADITGHVWDENHDPLSNNLEVYVGRLRRKIEAAGETPMLHTRRRAGYVFGPGDDA